jgi:hypothetical protein
MDTTDAPQIIEHVNMPLMFTPYDVRWVPSSARLVVMGMYPRGTGVIQQYEMSVGSLTLVSEVRLARGTPSLTPARAPSHSGPCSSYAQLVCSLEGWVVVVRGAPPAPVCPGGWGAEKRWEGSDVARPLPHSLGPLAVRRRLVSRPAPRMPFGCIWCLLRAAEVVGPCQRGACPAGPSTRGCACMRWAASGYSRHPPPTTTTTPCRRTRCSPLYYRMLLNSHASGVCRCSGPHGGGGLPVRWWGGRRPCHDM